jgi:2-methylisocitrate lyase-like PEP mutase family enzyme
VTNERSAALRRRLAEPGIIAAPSCWDGLSARLLQETGHEVAYVGGWVTGASLATTEPLTTMTEQFGLASVVARAVDLPVICDAGAGYGDPVHVQRTVREAELAGLSAIHIEDQVFPKRASYHRGLEHVVPAEEMVAKIRTALDARTDPDFVIIARTDAKPATGSLEECIRRCNIYAEAGADMVLPLRLATPAEASAVREAVPDIPLVFLSYFGGLTTQQVEDLGFKLMVYPMAAQVAGYAAVRDIYRQVRSRGIVDEVDIDAMAATRGDIERIISLPEYWEIEDRTTEKAGSASGAE